MTREEFFALLTIEENIIPKGSRNRPGSTNSLQYITIHNTDNRRRGADARAHGKFLINPGHYIHEGKVHWVSWHFTVDDKRIVKHLPMAEMAYHARDRANRQSVGIEICMHEGVDQPKAFLNAARLTALLLYDVKSLGRDTGKVVTHNYWTGKNCPRLLLDHETEGSKWNNFIVMVKRELDSITASPSHDTADAADQLTSNEEEIDLRIVENLDEFHLEENETVQE